MTEANLNEFKKPFDKGSNNKPQAANQNQNRGDPLKNINFELAELYFPMFVLQTKYDIFPLRNKKFGANYIQQQNQETEKTMEEQLEQQDDLIAYQEYMKSEFDKKCKIFFILRDFYLLTKVQITGTIVFYIKKDDKHFFGLDDSTGVLTCVLWLNDFNNRGGQGERIQGGMRQWLAENNVAIGHTLSILGGLEYYNDKIQLNVHKLRLINDTSEEMLQYKQIQMVQKVYFDPTKAFTRQLLGANKNSDAVQQKPAYMENKDKEATSAEKRNMGEGGAGIIQHSVKRVKKKVNDFILNNYNELFFSPSSKPGSVSKEGIDQIQTTETKKEISLSNEDILSNQKLIDFAYEELRLSEDAKKDPRMLLQECLQELEEKGFLNQLEKKADQVLYQIRDQREKLRHYIADELRKQAKGLSFDAIYKKVTTQFSNFYTKDFIFKVIDELFQMGLVYEIAKFTYAYLENN